MLRVALFIDGFAVHHAQRQSGWEIDFALLYYLITQNRAVGAAFYFAGNPTRDLLEPARRSFLKFQHRLSIIGFDFPECSRAVAVINGKTGGPIPDASSLAEDVIPKMEKEQSKYDLAILVGGGSGYEGIISRFEGSGKWLTVIYPDKMTLAELKEVKPRHIFVDLNLMKPALERVRGQPEPLANRRFAYLVANVLRLHPEIIRASLKSYVTENFSESVRLTYEAVLGYIKDVLKIDATGTNLIEQAFGEEDQLIVLRDCHRCNEQTWLKYMLLGTARIRATLAHTSVTWDEEKAFRHLAVASLLLERLEEPDVTLQGGGSP